MRSRRRLHPAAWLVHALGALREALLPAVVALVVSGRGITGITAIAVLAVGFSALLGWLRWSRTYYWADDEALHFVSGVLSPDHRSVPLGRIAAVDEVQGPVQRLFRLVAVHVQTAGGGREGEIVLHAVTLADAAALRDALRQAEPRAAVDEPEVPAWRLSPRALAVAAVTGPQIGVILPLLAGAGGLLGQVAGDEEAEDLLGRVQEAAGGWEMLALLAALAVVGLSLAGALVAFGGFVVYREPQRIRLHRGFLQRRVASVGVERIHAVRIVEGLLRRPLGLCSVRLEVAGYARQPAAVRTLVPLCRRDEVPGLLGRLVAELPVPAGAPERPPGRATRRYVLAPLAAGVAAGALVAAAVAVAGGPPLTWLAAAVAGLGGAGLGAVRARAAGWWLQDGIVAVRRHRVLARTTTVATAARLQHYATARSLPQRRARLATVRLAVASGHRATVAHLDEADADALLGALRGAG